MKALSISGLIIGLLGSFIGLVNQFHFRPIAKSLEESTTGLGDSLNDMSRFQIAADAQSFSVLLGEAALFICAFAFLLAIFPVIKSKSKTLPLIAVVISLIGIILGIIQGTHMFS